MVLFWAGLKNKSNLVISDFPLKRANLCEGKKDVINGLWFTGSQNIWVPINVAGVKDTNSLVTSSHLRTERGMKQLGPEMSPILWTEAGMTAADQGFQKT